MNSIKKCVHTIARRIRSRCSETLQMKAFCSFLTERIKTGSSYSVTLALGTQTGASRAHFNAHKKETRRIIFFTNNSLLKRLTEPIFRKY